MTPRCFRYFAMRVSSHHLKIISQAMIALTLFIMASSNNEALGQPRAAKETKDIAAIRLSQTHYFMGTQQVTIAPNAVRIDNTAQLGYVLVATAPNWKVTIFRPDDKTYFTEQLKIFQDTGMMSDMIIGRRERNFTDRPFRTTTMMLTGFKVERITSLRSTLKVLKLDGIAAPQIEKILYAAYKLPTNNCIPVAFTATHNNADFITGMQNKGKLEVLLETQKIEKVKVASNYFLPPANLKKAASIRDVVVGHANLKKSEAAEIMIEK